MPFALIATAIVLASLWFLWPLPAEFPMDDTYIHFVYARNLAEHGTLMFNFPDEVGVGSTSLLWVLLLAAGYVLGIPVGVTAKVLGIAALITVGGSLYALLRPIWQPAIALLATLLVVLSGHMLWFALSGMETMLFLALGVLALLAHRDEHWIWLGVLLGLLPLTRPEGLALAGAIALVDVMVHKRIRRGLVLSLVICGLLSSLWFGYLFVRTGHVLPTSGIGRRVANIAALQIVSERNPVLGSLSKLPALLYIPMWVLYTFIFVFGGTALPTPWLPIGKVLGDTHYFISVWAILGWVFVFIPLLWRAARRSGWPAQWWAWFKDDYRRPVMLLLAWTVLHNLSYMLFLPVTGTASRYGVMNHVVIWLALIVGLLSLKALRPRVGLALILALSALAAVNTNSWNRTYDANIDHMENVRIAAAYYVRDTFGDRVCAAYDIGAMRFYSQQPIVDLGGLIDPAVVGRGISGQLDTYLTEQHITCLIVPGRAGTTEDGWFDFIEIAGINDTQLFEMQQIQVFEVSRERWLRGFLPTGNYQATATIYTLQMPDTAN